MDARFIVGIDLGTTNIAVSYVDTTRGHQLESFAIPQLTAAGELADAALLPSFFFKPDPRQYPDNALTLPWNPENDAICGIMARNDGPENPSRFVHSAKSWLCHGGVDRTAPILPWGQNTDEKYSPLTITTAYLAHLKAAWDHRFAHEKDRDGRFCTLDNQQIILTVPASFDQAARDLTLEAANSAGFKNIYLLEEPLAAFYAWLQSAGKNWTNDLPQNEAVLVADIGGGTTDFTIIEHLEDGSLERTQTGDHLLLGGDNVDLALAKVIEQDWQRTLSPDEWALLTQKTRAAKETLLSEDAPESVEIQMLFKGSKLIGNAKQFTLTRDQVMTLITDGFYPLVNADYPAPAKHTGLRQMGLPYAKEPAVTAYLLDFLRQYVATGKTVPSRILFNGGSLYPELLRNRLIEAIGQWFPETERIILPSTDLSTAVATGAAVFGLSRLGIGQQVKSGSPRSYYLQVQSNPDRFVCIMKKGTAEQETVAVAGDFSIQTNQAVSFPLFASATRREDQPGEIIDDAEELSPICRLASLLKFGKGHVQNQNGSLEAVLNENGLLAVTVKHLETDHRWPLHFDVRVNRENNETAEAQISVSQETLDEAATLIKSAFENGGDALKSLAKNLEKLFEQPRKAWSLQTLRFLSDTLLDQAETARRTPQSFQRWLSLTGYALRPGFGDPGDELRIKTLWRQWLQDNPFTNQEAVNAEWWILWRRVASGLTPGQQEAVFSQAAKRVCPKGRYQKHVRDGKQAKAEIWRALGALELIPADRKKMAGDTLVNLPQDLESWEWWCLSRLGSRHLFHAPVNYTLPAKTVNLWLESLLKRSLTDELAQFALSRLASRTEERHLDADEKWIEKALDVLKSQNAPDHWQAHLLGEIADDTDEQSRVFGESLPLGFTLNS